MPTLTDCRRLIATNLLHGQHLRRKLSRRFDNFIAMLNMKLEPLVQNIHFEKFRR